MQNIPIPALEPKPHTGWWVNYHNQSYTMNVIFQDRNRPARRERMPVYEYFLEGRIVARIYYSFENYFDRFYQGEILGHQYDKRGVFSPEGLAILQQELVNYIGKIGKKEISYSGTIGKYIRKTLFLGEERKEHLNS